MDTLIQKEAIGHLTDADTLLRLALFERRWSLRSLAQERIEELCIKPEAPKEADENGFVTVGGRVRGYFGQAERPKLPETAVNIDSLWPNVSAINTYFYNPSKDRTSTRVDTIEAFLCVVWEPCGAQPRKTVASIKNRSPFLQADRIAKAALAAISDPVDFCYIARNDMRASVRRKAVNRAAKDETLFLELAIQDLDERVRSAAARRLQANESFDTLLREGTGAARHIAAERTSDLRLLKEKALTANDKRLQSIALTRVEDWSLLEILTMLGKTKEIAKGLARMRMEGMETQWRASGLALLHDNQRLYANAAMNDAMFYRLVIEHMTDENCIADILCSLSPHQAGATAYGPVGEAGYIAGNCHNHDPKDIARAKRALNRLYTKKALQQVLEQAKTHYLREEARKRLDKLQLC